MTRNRFGFTALLGGACITLASAAALAQHSGHDAAPNQTDPNRELKSDPYPLDTCPVSGEKLGGMGDPVVKTYDGREVRFCCNNCVKKFEADKAGYWKKIDEQIVKSQLPFYPLTTCPITGEALGGMGEPVNYVYNNRLVRFCCNNCVKKFVKDPKATLAMLDEAVIKQQMEHYPLTTCVVTDEVIGSDEAEEPVDIISNNHLVRLCCKGCIKKFEKEPATFLAKIDEAWKKQGGMPGADDAGSDDTDHKGDHDGGAHRDHK